MFGFFTSKPKATRATSAAPSRNSAPASKLGSVTTQKEVIRTAWRETLGFHGIPTDWVGCEITGVTRRDEVDDIYIQLVIKKWNEGLQRYGYALEQKLLSRINWYLPNQTKFSFVVSWRYDKSCQCPHLDMPNNKYWVPKTEEAPAAKSGDFLDRRRRPRPKNAPIFIRDGTHEIKKDELYASTSIAPLS
jgi:hypothetical protein